MEDDLSLAYNLSYDAWVIDLHSTTLPLAFSRSAPTRFAARERRRRDKSSASLGFSRPLLARLWETTRSWINACKLCRMRESMSKIVEQPQRRSVWFYGQMGHQDHDDDKVEAAILYCKKTLQMDVAATSSPGVACLMSRTIKMQQHWFRSLNE